jgi:hypothetical protein
MKTHPNGQQIDRFRTALARGWPSVLIAVLAVIYAAFGIIARNAIGLLGIVGAVVIVVVAARPAMSRWAAAGLLIVGVIPFAVVALWTVVIPLTALLALALGLPHVLGHRTRSSLTGGGRS